MGVTQSIYDGPPRGYTKRRTDKRWIVIHNTSNDASAEDEASYAKRRTDSVSSHYYVDGSSIVQSLDTDYRAWHVGSPEGNAGGIGYEITGTNAKSRAWWMDHVAWGLLAGQIRRDCAEHSIAPRLLSISQIRSGETGIITHDQARRAWGGTTHTDPGPGFPLDYLVDMVKGATPSVSSGAPAPTLREGDEGPRVERLQAALNAALDADLAVDGDYGPATAAAVRTLQARAGITRDSIYGPDTERALTDLLEDDMRLDDRVDYGPWYSETYGDEGGTVEQTLAELMAYSRNSSDKTAAVKTQQAKQQVLLEQILAAQSGLTEGQITAAVAAGVRSAIDPAELAAAIADGLDHKLDVETAQQAVEAALRHLLGGEAG